MKYTVILEKPVIRFLQSHSDIAKKLFDKAKEMENDFDLSRFDIQKLQGSKNNYRLRIGKYRFLFRLEHQIITIYFYDADSRGDIYK